MTKVIRIKRKKHSASLKPLKAERAQRRKKYDFSRFTQEKYKIFMLIICVAAVACGSLIYRFYSNSNINGIITEKVFAMQNSGFAAALVFLLKTDFLFLALSFFLGTSYAGKSLVFFPSALKCLIIGYTGGLMYNEFELKGVLFCLLFIYPYAVITTASLIFAANESAYMSGYVLKLVTNKNTADDISARLYFLRYLFLAVINCACAAVNAGIICFLAGKIAL